jgi:translation initiation factor IF-1
MTIEGIVVEALPGASFRVRLDGDKEVIAYVAGKMRVRKIRVLPGDKVKVELTSPKDERGRIVWRL